MNSVVRANLTPAVQAEVDGERMLELGQGRAAIAVCTQLFPVAVIYHATYDSCPAPTNIILVSMNKSIMSRQLEKIF